MVIAILLRNIIDDFPSTFETKVRINIRWANPLRVEESFKQQIIFQGIQVCNTQNIGCQTAGS